jgi:small-conductance mechanosensitive channel
MRRWTFLIAAASLGIFLQSASQASTLSLLYQNSSSSPISNAPNFSFEVQNKGTDSIEMPRLEVRYWFFLPKPVSQTSHVYWAGQMPSGENITSACTMKLVPCNQGGQNYYASFSFSASAGRLEGGKSFQVNAAFNADDWSPYDQGTHYSYGKAEALLPWQRMTAYLDGELAWGKEPGEAAKPRAQAVARKTEAARPVERGSDADSGVTMSAAMIQHELAPVGDWTLAAAILAAWILVGGFIARLVFGSLRRGDAAQGFFLPEAMARAVAVPVYALVTVTGFMVSARYAPFLGSDAQRISRLLQVGLALALVYLSDNILQTLAQKLEARHSELKGSHLLISAIIHILVWMLGLTVVLRGLGMSVTPLLASLGVGSLAVALALQSTLANLFSGFYLILDKPIRVGDYVKLPSGDQGFIQTIGWRTTRIRTPDNSILVIPNSKLAENQILNFHLPDSLCTVAVELAVDPQSDLEAVERFATEVANTLQAGGEGADPDFRPLFLYDRIDPQGVRFKITLRTRSAASNDLIRHAFIKGLQGRFLKEGIALPRPMPV